MDGFGGLTRFRQNSVFVGFWSRRDSAASGRAFSSPPQPTVIPTGAGGSARGTSGAVEGPAVPPPGALHLAVFEM